MTYEEAIRYLYTATPVFQHSGGAAYKPGLERVEAMAEALGQPHHALRCIHVAGTNGKGSVCHTLAAILQAAGYRVGLFTSPHLVDFRERIRVNGQKIEGAFVARFVDRTRELIQALVPSFFELTTLMALDYFREQTVDIAVIEVGMGGRLDSTNIVNPLLSIITGISLDHTQFLGHTTAEIASEKAGIIKTKTPVVIGEADTDTRPVFLERSQAVEATIFFASDSKLIRIINLAENGRYRYDTRYWGRIESQLMGDVQTINTHTVLMAISVLTTYDLLVVPAEAVQRGFAEVVELTGLRGRWQEIAHSPMVVCDTAHNEGGMRPIVAKLGRMKVEKLRIVFGMVADKDISHVLQLLPSDACYYFCQASVDRALPAADLALAADSFGLKGEIYSSVVEGYQAALAAASPADLIYVGGSNFVVADLLAYVEA